MSSKNLVISLEKESIFQEGQIYYFVFDNLVNLDNQKIVLEPVEIIAGDQAELLKIIKTPELDISNDSAEISWHLNNDHQAELYFGEDLTGKYNCLGQSCPRLMRVMPHAGVEAKTSFMGRNFIRGLKSNTAYYYIIRALDHQGQIMVSGGVFRTRMSPTLRFSEILINPHKKPEHRAEFIELIYAGEQPKKFENLKLIIEHSVCVLASPENLLVVHPGDYILIVGHDFDEQSARVPSNAVIVRLPKKNLCGGLANERPSSIKLVDEKGMLDHYGGYLWHAPEGVSVMRRDNRGLDDFDNYCYSDPARGPTPGAIN